MAYPTLPQTYGTKEEVYDGRIVDRATNGKPRIRRLYDRGWREFSVVHEILTLEAKELLQDFYEENKDTTFDFVKVSSIGSETISCQFAAAPQYDEQDFGYMIATVRLIQVA